MAFQKEIFHSMKANFIVVVNTLIVVGFLVKQKNNLLSKIPIIIKILV